MGFLKKLFGGFNDYETSQEATVSNNDYWRNFFGIDLKSSPNSDWKEHEREYNYSGQLIRNFRLYDLPDSYFTEISVKVISKKGTNFFFTCPYSYDDSFDIYYIIERDLIHHGNLKNTDAGKKFRGKFQSGCKMINWNKIDGCSIMMDRDEDSGDIKLTVWTNFYNEEFLDAGNDHKESEDEIHTEAQTSNLKRNAGKIYYNMSYRIDPVSIEYRNKTILDGKMNFSIVGIQHRDNFEELMRRIKVGTPVVLKPEPDNPYDPKALAFYLKDETLLGYLPKKDQPFARIFFAKGYMEGEICEIDDKWLDSEFILSSDMIDKIANANSEVKISCEASYGFMNRKSESVSITDIFDLPLENETTIHQSSKSSLNSELDQYYKKARHARENGDWDDVEECYKKILSFMPNDWEANFFLAYTECIRTSINEIGVKVSDFRTKLIKIFVCMFDFDDKESQNDALKEIYDCSFSIGTQYFNAAMNYFKELDGEDINDDDEKIFGINCRLTAGFVQFLGDEIIEASDGDLSNLAIEAWEEGNNQWIKFAKAIFFIGDVEKREISETINEYADKIKKYCSDAKNPIYGDRFFKIM